MTTTTMTPTMTPTMTMKASLKKNTRRKKKMISMAQMTKRTKRTRRTRKTRKTRKIRRTQQKKRRRRPRPAMIKGMTTMPMRLRRKKRKIRKRKPERHTKTTKKNKKEKKDEKEKKAVKDDEGDDDDGNSSDAGGEGQASKEKGGELDYDDDELKPVINILAGLAESKGNSLKAAEYFEELTNQRLANNFDQKTSLYVTMEALCGKEMGTKALEDKAKYFDKVIGSQKLSGTDVLWALGAYLDMNSSAKRSFAQQLKVVFEQEWAEEKTILEFYNDEEGASTPGFADAQQAASPCLKWLAEADEDDDDDNDSDSDDESDD